MTTATAPVHTPRIRLTMLDVVARYRVSERTIRNWMKHDNFPRPLKIGNRVTWDLAALEAFEAENTAALAAQEGRADV